LLFPDPGKSYRGRGKKQTRTVRAGSSGLGKPVRLARGRSCARSGRKPGETRCVFPPLVPGAGKSLPVASSPETGRGLKLEVYTLVPREEIEDLHYTVTAGGNPMDAKSVLARSLVERYHGTDTARQEEEWFRTVFSQRATPDDVPIIALPTRDLSLLEVLRACLPEASSSEIRRLVQDGAVRIGEKNLSASRKRAPWTKETSSGSGSADGSVLPFPTTDVPPDFSQ